MSESFKTLQKFVDHYHSENALPFEESGITMSVLDNDYNDDYDDDCE